VCYGDTGGETGGLGPSLAAEATLPVAPYSALVEDTFPFTGVLRAFPSAFVFEARIDPEEILGGPFASALPSVSVKYTEATRAMRRAERRVIEETKREVAARFDR